LVRLGLRIKKNEDYAKKYNISEDCIIREYIDGNSIWFISQEHKCPGSFIERVLKKHGIKIRKGKEAWAGSRKKIKEKKIVDGYINICRASFRNWKKNAEERNLDWDLTIGDIEDVFNKQCGLCFYSKIPLLTHNLDSEYTKLRNNLECISLDRIDSSKGYYRDNVVLCCVPMNLAKSDWEFDKFTAFIRRAAYTIIYQDNNHAASIPAHWGIMEGAV
jgi:hypothetical protein